MNIEDIRNGDYPDFADWLERADDAGPFEMRGREYRKAECHKGFDVIECEGRGNRFEAVVCRATGEVFDPSKALIAILGVTGVAVRRSEDAISELRAALEVRGIEADFAPFLPEVGTLEQARREAELLVPPASDAMLAFATGLSESEYVESALPPVPERMTVRTPTVLFLMSKGPEGADSAVGRAWLDGEIMRLATEGLLKQSLESQYRQAASCADPEVLRARELFGSVVDALGTGAAPECVVGLSFGRASFTMDIRAKHLVTALGSYMPDGDLDLDAVTVIRPSQIARIEVGGREVYRSDERVGVSTPAAIGTDAIKAALGRHGRDGSAAGEPQPRPKR